MRTVHGPPSLSTKLSTRQLSTHTVRTKAATPATWLSPLAVPGARARRGRGGGRRGSQGSRAQPTPNTCCKKTKSCTSLSCKKQPPKEAKAAEGRRRRTCIVARAVLSPRSDLLGCLANLSRHCDGHVGLRPALVLRNGGVTTQLLGDLEWRPRKGAVRDGKEALRNDRFKAQAGRQRPTALDLLPELAQESRFGPVAGGAVGLDAQPVMEDVGRRPNHELQRANAQVVQHGCDSRQVREDNADRR
mmetsp:Transcript_74595/g.228265  ORF Transcript_74595/g.228265 Transcript_74595/m.228265 type:complete len:246 (+) Transcript_74595:201-938(+)